MLDIAELKERDRLRAALLSSVTRIEGSDRSKGGTGLGLAIVKGIAEAMGLSVEAANRGEPCGARFSLHFPESLLVREPDQEQNV